jgi:hypothetical protein
MVKFAVYDHRDNRFYVSMTMTAIAAKFKLNSRQVKYVIDANHPVKGLSIGKPERLKIKSRLDNIEKNLYAK